MIYVKDLLEWIQKSGLKGDDPVYLDRDGETLKADSVKQIGAQPGVPFIAYLWVGDGTETATDRPPIGDRHGRDGEMVFWAGEVDLLGPSLRPWWIVDWQHNNDRMYVIVNAAGDIRLAYADELTRNFREV